MNELPEPDRLEGIKHPAETSKVFGHETAKTEFLRAFHTDHIHHAWMLTGPKGIGKATLAYKIAQFLLSQEETTSQLFDKISPNSTLDTLKDHPITKRIRAGSEPGLFVIRRPLDEKTLKLKKVITVDTVRELRHFFSLSASGNGRRVVIVDCLDDMNNNAANALLKILEEPPKSSTLLLIVNQPSQALPTIRSRCQTLNCKPLSITDLQTAFEAAAPGVEFNKSFANLSGGSVGRALQLAFSEGLGTYNQIIDLFFDLPKLDRGKLLKLANLFARTTEENFEQLQGLFDVFLARMALFPFNISNTDQTTAAEREVFKRLCPDQRSSRLWADTQLELSQRLRKGQEANLDPSSLILDMGFKVEQTAAKILN